MATLAMKVDGEYAFKWMTLVAFAAPQRDFHLPPVFSDHMVVQQGDAGVSVSVD